MVLLKKKVRFYNSVFLKIFDKDEPSVKTRQQNVLKKAIEGLKKITRKYRKSPSIAKNKK
jgi:hypothetical protein